MRDKIIFAVVAVIAVIVGALVFVSGRGNFSKSSPSASGYSNETATAVPFTKLAQGTQSSVSTRTNYLITSPGQLDELWKMIDATGTPPAVDFNTKAVLAVFAAKQSSTSIKIAKIEDTTQRVVSISIAVPDGSCAKNAPAVAPYELVAVASTTLPITHEDIPTIVNCPKN